MVRSALRLSLAGNTAIAAAVYAYIVTALGTAPIQLFLVLASRLFIAAGVAGQTALYARTPMAYQLLAARFARTARLVIAAALHADTGQAGQPGAAFIAVNAAKIFQYSTTTILRAEIVIFVLGVTATLLPELAL